MPLPFFALVDYDNVVNSQETALKIVEQNLELLTERISRFIQRESLSCNEVVLRLYGGWITKGGSYSTRGDWLLKSLHHAKCRKNGLRFRPEMVVSLMGNVDHKFSGTYRPDEDNKQKMVD